MPFGRFLSNLLSRINYHVFRRNQVLYDIVLARTQRAPNAGALEVLCGSKSVCLTFPSGKTAEVSIPCDAVPGTWQLNANVACFLGNSNRPTPELVKATTVQGAQGLEEALGSFLKLCA